MIRLSPTQVLDPQTRAVSPGVQSLAVGDDPYTVLATDTLLFCDTSGGRLDLTLPEAPVAGREITVVDVGLAAGTDRIRLARSGADTIDGGTAYDVDEDGGAVVVTYDAANTNWSVATRTTAELLNTVHRSSTGRDHSGLNNNLVDAVITVADATGGATGAALTVQINDQSGAALAKEAVVLILASDSQYGGRDDQNTNVTFGTASVGSILASGSGWAVVKCSAAGAFACTATNAADEGVYFSVTSANGGHDAVANGCAVRGCVPDLATWSA